MKFAQTNLLAESGNLSQAHLKYLQSVQDAITKQNPQEMQASKIVNDAINTLHAEMKTSGINPTPEPGSPEEKKQAQTEADLRDQLIAAQQAKNGTPLTPSEAQNRAMGYFADHVLNGKGGFGRDESEGQKPTASRPGEVTGSQSNALGDSVNAMPHGAVAAAGTMDEQRAQDGHPNEKEHPAFALEEFNKYAKTSRSLEYRSKQATRDKKKLVVSPEEQKQLVEMQQSLGIKQTGKYDDVTRRALQAAFIDLIRPAAVEQEKKYGIPAAVTIGQAILESGYGRHIPTDIKTGQLSNNFFGIKPDKKEQPFVSAWTHEYDKKGNLVPMIQPFAVYDNINGSVQEHSTFLKRNKNYRTLFSTSDPEQWAQGLQDAGYGGKNNKTYADALINTMRMWKLIK